MSTSMIDAEEWVPRADYEELRAQYHEVREQRDFILQVIAVPDHIMKASDKITNIVIDHKLRNHAANEKGFTPLNVGELAQCTGQGYKTVGRSKKLLAQKMNLYEQETVKMFHAGKDGQPTMTQNILLKATPAQRYPRLYETSEPITWGGKKERKEAPVCPKCGSENVDLVETHICHHCHEVSHNEIHAAPLSTTQEATEQTQEEERESIGQLDPVITTLPLGQVDLTPHEEPVMPENVCARCGDIPIWVLTPLGQKICSCSQYSREELKAQRKVRQPALL